MTSLVDGCTRLYAKHGRTAHLQMPGDTYADVYCRIDPPPAWWLGTGSQAEYDRAALLPSCRRCLIARGDVGGPQNIPAGLMPRTLSSREPNAAQEARPRSSAVAAPGAPIPSARGNTALPVAPVTGRAAQERADGTAATPAVPRTSPCQRPPRLARKAGGTSPSLRPPPAPGTPPPPAANRAPSPRTVSHLRGAPPRGLHTPGRLRRPGWHLRGTPAGRRTGNPGPQPPPAAPGSLLLQQDGREARRTVRVRFPPTTRRGCPARRRGTRGARLAARRRQRAAPGGAVTRPGGQGTATGPA